MKIKKSIDQFKPTELSKEGNFRLYWRDKIQPIGGFTANHCRVYLKNSLAMGAKITDFRLMTNFGEEDVTLLLKLPFNCPFLPLITI